jgi:hypothetical protein
MQTNPSLNLTRYGRLCESSIKLLKMTHIDPSNVCSSDSCLRRGVY